MDKYERVIRDIQGKTRDRHVKWIVVNPSGYEKVLTNPNQVRRLNRADYNLRGRKYELCFVEKIIPAEDDFGGYYESLNFQLLILDEDGEIVFTIHSGVVERDDLLKLAGLIDENNDRTQEFFAAFDETTSY